MGSREDLFRARVFSVWHFLILFPFGFMTVLLTWLAAKEGFPGILSTGISPIILFVVIIVLPFILFLTSVLFTRIRLDNDGAVAQSPFAFGGGIFYSLDELRTARWSLGGRAVSFSGSMINYWIVPLKHRELSAMIEKRILAAPQPITPLPRIKRIDHVVLFGPVLILGLLVRVLRLCGFSLDPLIQAAAWTRVGSFSAYCFAYRTWGRFKIDRLGRRGNAIAYGLLTGLPVFVIALLLYT